MVGILSEIQNVLIFLFIELPILIKSIIKWDAFEELPPLPSVYIVLLLLIVSIKLIIISFNIVILIFA